jgi:5-methylcytosine-specific restriction endonuclease McrA
MRVVDHDTGKEFFLDSTPELTSDLDPLHAPCSHTRKELRQKRNRGGAIQYIDQCLQCGTSVGLFRKHSPELINVPTWDEKLEPNYTAAKQSERAAIIQKHVRIQRNRSIGFWKQYNEYLQSDEWVQRRAKVLERASGQCEGCRTKRATQIHHLTYAHVFKEFLFELVAICDDCHKTLHTDDDCEENSSEHDDLNIEQV